jgi:hypothetical protein
MMERSPEERLKMGASMFNTAKKIVLLGIKQKWPNASEDVVRCQLFLRFYANDFNETQRNKIVSWLMTHG